MKLFFMRFQICVIILSLLSLSGCKSVNTPEDKELSTDNGTSTVHELENLSLSSDSVSESSMNSEGSPSKQTPNTMAVSWKADVKLDPFIDKDKLAAKNPEVQNSPQQTAPAQPQAPKKAANKLQELKVHSSGRFLMYADGTPFFYLGDTAWELFQRLNREEADRYLTDRKQKNFNVIQAVVIVENKGLKAPNKYGHLPLINNNPLQPNEKYFEHVDYIVSKANDLGLYVGLLPAWGDLVTEGIFNPGYDNQGEEAAKHKAYSYGKFLGERYGYRHNIIWILGGDRVADGVEDIWREMARGIKDGQEYGHLMSFHPFGFKSSSEWFHWDEWLDFNIFQTGHSKKNDIIYKKISEDYNKQPVKPCMEGEATYEGFPVRWDPKNGWFDDTDTRKAAYWSVFAGGCGFTYGANSIWQMYEKGRKSVGYVSKYWYEALDLPGAADMQHLRKLMESRPFFSRIPDQSVISAGEFSVNKYMQATRSKDGSYIFVYIPEGNEVTINTHILSGSSGVGYWYNPREGTHIEVGRFEKTGPVKFTPPSSGLGNDWVLVLDDADKKFPPPGPKAK